MDGNVKAIELQGIVRNRTKIGVEDGQAEDLLNLRFVDGSWRTSGDGRKVYMMSDNANGYHYTQLYIHTNVYRHLLGVRDGKLWWFADIQSDGVTFAPKSTPEELTAVTGDMWITQTGHLLTVIDEDDSFEYFLFKKHESCYNKIYVDTNGSQSDRTLYPFGNVHFNFYSPQDEEHTHSKVREEQTPKVTPAQAHADMIEMFKEATDKNQFTRPFLAIVACKTYDGSYIYSSNPTLIFPRNLAFLGSGYIENWGISETGEETKYSAYPNADSTPNNYYDSYIPNVPIPKMIEGISLSTFNDSILQKVFSPKYARGRRHKSDKTTSMIYVPTESAPTYVNGGGRLYLDGSSNIPDQLGLYQKFSTIVFGSDLCFSIDNLDLLKQNSGIITSVCIFVTPQIDIYDMSAEGYKNSPFNETSITYAETGEIKFEHMNNLGGSMVTSTYDAIGYTYFPAKRTREQIIYDLLHSPFYLLKEYSTESSVLLTDRIIDLSSVEDEGVLSNITQQDTLKIESTSRATYIPKYTYAYNGRLHIANYTTFAFHGYPIDCFHLNNHSVKSTPNEYFKGVIPDLNENYDAYMQYPRDSHYFPSLSADMIEWYKSNKRMFAFVEVDIETDDGIQKVVRYIEPYIVSPAQNGRADFIENLDAIISYPDKRAKKMRTCICAIGSSNNPIFYENTFLLQPHPLYNIAYYVNPNLIPISTKTLNRIVTLPSEQNTTEYYPNGIKVSATHNPLVFPVENTYQIGSSEILAMCSNSIAVGTGQTGAAPLYVFCSDGIYALFVDSSGEMTYTNARVIARDVLNNPRSVTPIDAGVAFTTDRGLMLIAGEQVQEIGQPAEGDVLRYTDDHSADFIKIAEGAFTKVADFPNTLCDKTDFLTYLTSAIVNYNHNERELMISNPEKDYSYILDRNGNWSRRDYSADEYIQNYPTSYRLRDGEFYKVDEEGDNDTILEKRKEADNKFFYLSNVIKLDSIGFKQAARFALRGYFDTKREVVHEYSGMCVQNGYFDIVLDYKTKIKPRTHYRMTFENQSALIGTDLSISYGARATNGDIYVSETGEHKIPDSPDYAPIELNIYTSAFDHGKDVDALVVRLFNNGNTSSICKGKITFQEMNDDFSTEQNDYIGCYIFGSYDGRKWAMLGGNEKQGKFTDIGCKIERTDVKFFRICLSGKLRGESRIDYMEISSEPSILNGKIR